MELAWRRFLRSCGSHVFNGITQLKMAHCRRYYNALMFWLQKGETAMLEMIGKMPLKNVHLFRLAV